jgi:hypothetical protein
MSQTPLKIVYVKNRNGQVSAERENASMDTSRSVSEILQLLGSMKQLSPNTQLFISVDPGRKLSDLGIQAGSTIIVMEK